MRPGRLASRPSRGARPLAGVVSLAVAVSLSLASVPAAAGTPGYAVPTAPPPASSPPIEVLPVAPPPPAEAPMPPPIVEVTAPPADGALDQVVLRDGSIIRGTLAEVFHGRRVTIVSATGQQHTFTWDQIADIDYAGGEPVAVMGPGRPLLHVETDKPLPVRLFEVTGEYQMTRTPSRSGYSQVQPIQPVCRAPCDIVVDGSRGQSFFFGGEGIMQSRRFTLDEHDGPMLARVRPGRVRTMLGGIFMSSMSTVPLISGALFTGLGGHADTPQSRRTFNTGVTLTAVGVGMLISGIVMIALGRTRVELYRRYTGAAQRRPR